MKTSTYSRRQARADDRRCQRIVKRWRRDLARAERRQRAALRLRALPHWHELGQFLYVIGFLVEYELLRAGRGLLRFAALILRGVVDVLAALLQPLGEALPAASAAPGRRGRAARIIGAAAAAVCAAVFLLLVRAALGRRYLLRVEMNGQVLGYITNEQMLDTARAAVYERMDNARAVLEAAGQTPQDEEAVLSPTYTLAAADEPAMTQTELVNALLRATGGALQEATAVYVDGALWSVTNEGDHLRSFLQSLLAPYADVYDPDQRVEFLHSLELTDGLYYSDSVLPAEEVVQRLIGDETQPLQVCTIERSTYTEDIPYPSVSEESAAYEYGETIVLQAGQNGLREITQDTVAVDGVAREVRTISVQTLREPVTEQLVTGTQLKDYMRGERNGVSFIWPVPQYNHVSRWMGSGHKGADIAATQGTPILASAAGTVTTAYRWNGIRTQGDRNSYGNYVVIDHGGGYRTLYGHMTHFVVNVGDYVEQGQVIGYVGNTGYSFGAHCHFEMYDPNGRFSARAIFPNVPRYNR